MAQISASYIAPSNFEQKHHKQGPQFQSKPLSIVHGFRPETENFDIGKKNDAMEKHISRGAEWRANFSFIYSTFQFWQKDHKQ